MPRPEEPRASAPSDPPPEEAASRLLATLEDLDLDRFTIVGRYARFDPGLRASLDEFRQRLVAAVGSRGGRPQNFLLWGPPGSGKSFLVQQIAAGLPEDARFLELNLSRLEEAEFRSLLRAAWDAPGRLVCFVDEVDARPTATWPYEVLLSYLEPPVARDAATCFVLAGSGGASSVEMRRTMEARPKGRDLLSRVPVANEYRVDPLGTGDRILVAAVQFLDAAQGEGHTLRDVEKLALYYVAANPAFASARQLRALADQSAQRIPPGEVRLRYDHLFRPGDPENKEFWSRVASGSAPLVGTSIRVRPAPATAAPPRTAPRERTLETPEASPRRSARVAVLPFRNVSPDPADAYLADGLTEEILATISTIPGLEVVSRTSIVRYHAGVDKSATEIGRELNAGSLLGGSVRKSGSRIRITAQLIDAPTDRQLWSEVFDGDLADVFGMQKEIATRVARALSASVGGRPVPVPRARPTPNIEAYVLFLKGRAAYREATREGLERAIDLYGQAVAIDPTYAEALAGIAAGYRRLGFWEMAPSREAFLKAREFSERALTIDPMLLEARLTRAALLRAIDWDFASSEAEYREILTLWPQDADVRTRLANDLTETGRFAEAARLAREAIELEPQSSSIVELAGSALLYAREYPEAARALRIALTLDPQNTAALHNLGLALVQAGSPGEGISMMEEALRRSASPSPIQFMELAYGNIRAGRRGPAEKVLDQIVQRAGPNPAWWGAAAGVYANLDQPDRAFEALDIALAHHAGFLASHLRVDFIFEPLRSDPRFSAILRRIQSGPASASSG
ncbi:MAG TPA: tetratricopeptide repeat protein [Thermoplasmata archaeon]|nr:tetratricopeptide repeat protein [Thermoplasmata archaeon]